MDHFGGPAVLGGVITGLMLWAWALGRWQSGLPAAPVRAQHVEPLMFDWDASDDQAPPAVRACQQPASDEQRPALDTGASLGQIHAEVSAYRRAAQVLSHLDTGESTLADAHAESCRYLGISGTPTCSPAELAEKACTCGSCTSRRADVPIRMDQPSAEPVGFTRV